MAVVRLAILLGITLRQFFAQSSVRSSVFLLLRLEEGYTYLVSNGHEFAARITRENRSEFGNMSEHVSNTNGVQGSTCSTFAVMLFVRIVVFVTAVAALPHEQIFQRGSPPHASGGLPVAGEVWGPVITHAGTMQNTQHGLFHKYRYSTPEKSDVLADYILTSEIFQTKDKMYAYVQSVVKDENIVIQSNPALLEGKYLEILTTKIVPSDKVKITCHSYKTKPAFCHRLDEKQKGTQHKVKMMYSMVKETSSGKAFPCVFFSHQGCAEKDNEDSCYWVTHINEVVIIDKYLI